MRLLTGTSLFIFTFFVTAFTYASPSTSGIMDLYDSKQIAEHTWVILGDKGQPNIENKGFMNNPVFVITNKSVVVIDPGSSLQVGQALLKKIQQQTNKPVTHVFNTHVHGDHWLGNQAFQEANAQVKFFAHPQMIKEAKDGEADIWIKLMSSSTAGATDGTKAVIPSNPLIDGQEITIDNITIKSHLSEYAHTKTDAMFEIIEDKVLITGDNAFNDRMTRLDDGSFIGNIKVLDDALLLDIDVVVPGHGENGDKTILRSFRKFLSIIYETSKNLLEDDMEDFEMKPIIISKLKDYQSWNNFDGAIGKLISIAVLEAENE